MHIVLHEPEIPGNTGNIGRSCAATNTSLHLIEPLGFEITEKNLRRAGLDYWAKLDVRRYRDYEDFLLENFGEAWPSGTPSGTAEGSDEKTGSGGEGRPVLPAGSPDALRVQALRADSSMGKKSGSPQGGRPPRLWFATTKAKRLYCEADFGPDDYIMFGKESAGIPEEILVDNEDTCIRIPMGFGIRSLNLSNAVAIVLYEALRQNQFSGLEMQGDLHRLHWKQVPDL